MTERHTDTITICLALTVVAATLLVRGLVAAGALAAQVLDALAGNDHQPPGGGTTLPAVMPVVITSTRNSTETTPNLAVLTVPQLRQLLRGTGTPSWWSMNRQQCLTALAGGAC